MAQQGPARRSVATRVPAVIGLPELVVARHDAVAKAAKTRQAVGGRRRLPPPAHPLQAPPLLPRVRVGGLRGAHRALRPPADGGAGRARAHAGRRGGVAAPGRAGDGRHRRCPPPPSSSWVAWPSATAATSTATCAGSPSTRPASAAGPGATCWILMEERRAEAEAAQPPVRRTLRAVPSPGARAPSPSPHARRPRRDAAATRPPAAASPALAPRPRSLRPAGMSPRRRP